MAVVILDLALLFVTHVPSKVDTASLQALWKVRGGASLMWTTHRQGVNGNA